MKLEIRDDRRLFEIQEDFNVLFPFLKIEFFKAPHRIGEGSAKILIYENSRYVRDCRVKHQDGDLVISEKMTVNELEESFLREFGLSAQVFRKSGNVWLETSATDNWTLRQQNSEGAELSTQIRDKRENADDTDMY
ncbi:MAG: hypothetical protein JNL88_10540 [Bacteroidia bacterium]|nr:hypothetical protein [Bacteroidia bacterium]